MTRPAPVVLRHLANRDAIVGGHDVRWAERRYQQLLAEHGVQEPSTEDRRERTA